MKSILSKLHAFFILGWVPLELHLRVGTIHINLSLQKLDVRSPTIGATLSADFRRQSFFLVFEGYAGLVGLSIDAYNDAPKSPKL